MSLNDPNILTSLVTQFKGSMQAQDPYAIDPTHGLSSVNIDFIVSPTGEVQAMTRRGTSQVFQIPNADGAIQAMAPWYFSYLGNQDCYAVYYASAVGVKALTQFFAGFTGVLMGVTGASSASFATDGLRLYAAFQDSSGRLGFAGAEVYGLVNGTDGLFAQPLQTTVATITATVGGAGVITAGIHRLAYVFTTRNGYTGALNPVDSGGVFAPASFTAADGTHAYSIAINFLSVPSYLTPGGTVQVAMSSVANPARIFLVARAVGNVPGAPGTVNITISITDNDLVEGAEVTQNQNFLTASQAGAPPFKPSALFLYSSRMGYCAFDSASFPVVYFSDQNAYQSLTAAFHGIYLEGRQVPVQGASLGGTCYIATLSGLYSTQDNGGLPETWVPPSHVDGSVGILAASCMLLSGGRILMASEKGLYVFRGGAFPQIPISYWQAPDWNRINWANPFQVQVVDDVFDNVIRVLAPLTVLVVAASNTNPIVITTAVLINNVPVAAPHLFQTGLSVTITGVLGNTAANTTQNITVTDQTHFTVPVAGNGAYTGSGVVTPNTPNAVMCWSYPKGDMPGQTFYSIHAFQAYRTGAIATIRNIATNKDETWFAPSGSNPGGIIRRVLPTDAPKFRDLTMSAGAVAIYSSYETALLPGFQDESTTVHDYHGAHLRVSGIGPLALACYGLDHVISVIPMASPITLSQTPGAEILVKWFVRSEQQSIQFGTNLLDAYFIMALMRVYYTESLPMR